MLSANSGLVAEAVFQHDPRLLHEVKVRCMDISLDQCYKGYLAIE